MKNLFFQIKSLTSMFEAHHRQIEEVQSREDEDKVGKTQSSAGHAVDDCVASADTGRQCYLTRNVAIVELYFVLNIS